MITIVCYLQSCLCKWALLNILWKLTCLYCLGTWFKKKLICSCNKKFQWEIDLASQTMLSGMAASFSFLIPTLPLSLLFSFLGKYGGKDGTPHNPQEKESVCFTIETDLPCPGLSHMTVPEPNSSAAVVCWYTSFLQLL